MTTLRIGSAPLVKTNDQRRAERRALLERAGRTVDWMAHRAFLVLAGVAIAWLHSGNYIPLP